MKKLSFLIVVFWFLVFWWPFDWKAHADTYSCRQNFWIHAIEASVPWKCTCEKGYIWNYDKTKCIESTKEAAIRNCQRDFWIHATMGESIYDCVCEDGYEWNSEGKECIKVTVDSAQDSCERNFWPYSVVNLENWKCECVEWSVPNRSNNYCIKKFLVGGVSLSEEREYAIAWLYENLWETSDIQNIVKPNNISRQESAGLLMQIINNVRKWNLEYETNETIKDIQKADSDLQTLIKEAFQVGLFKWEKFKLFWIFPIGKPNFYPHNEITKADALYAIIKALRGMKAENVSPWYLNYYLDAEKLWILNELHYNLEDMGKETMSSSDFILLLYRVEKIIGDELCTKNYGELSLWDGTKDVLWHYNCWCQDWAREVAWGCVLDEIVDIANKECKETYWEHAYSNGESADHDGFQCRCQKGYNRDNEKNPTRCI